ncbi:MAG TPA: hypothetical protein VIK74_00940 [Parasegetibacter sp.]|jgi:hypothetical protein
MKFTVQNKLQFSPIPDAELADISGGFIPLLVIGVCALMAGCVQTNQQNGQGNSQINSMNNGQSIGDSTTNKNDANLKLLPK